jgi:type I restriction enzyme S subunit
MQSGQPKIRFNGFAGDWEERKLGDISTTYSGGTPSVGNREFYVGSIPFIRSAEISATTTELFISEDALKNSSAKLIKKGYILYALYGATSGEVSRAQIDGAINQAVLAIIPNISYNSDYIAEWLRKEKQNIISKYLQGGQGNLSGQIIQQLKIPLANEKEQEKIGSFFRQMDDLISLQKDKLQKLQNIKKSLLQKMFPKPGHNAPELRFKGFAEPWQQRKLGEMGSTYTGLSGKTSEDFGHGKAKFITYMNIFSNPVCDCKGIEPIEIDNSQNEVLYGDVFFTTSSETPEEVGMSSVCTLDEKNLYLNSFCFGYRPNKNIFDLNYLAYMLRSSTFRQKIILLAQGISRYNISKNAVMEISVPVPEIEEQIQVGIMLKKLDSLISLQKDKLQNLQNIKKSLLQKMFI